ncbi:Cyst wall protein, type 1A [Carpediemonas membranifera]|uniref:Cyst wall protein, type 1A n=1 Tax=Carpediemonas membranifera TaxID=201153 RepID=A0A8J6AWU2_9EUKA|nr:Cyst wall protein, type 1A [Carpediemonas membranifera]|eukprot:KAG9394475.1 Cyst wall protein, type 1A [Carpediemonas membranifera]
MKFGTTLVVLGLIATVFAQCVITEEEALMNMYVALGGDSWTDNTNWNTGDVCTWYGIGCNIDGYVVSIDLSNNNLVGLLTDDIGCFPYLKSLQLNDNEISGPVPDAIGNLPSLKYLNLDNNLLTGPLPATLCADEHLQYIYLGHNLFEGDIPACYVTNFTFVKGGPPRLQPAHRRPPRLLRLRVHVRAPLPLQQLQRRVPRLDRDH